MALRESDGVLTLNIFDEIMTPAAKERLERERDAAARRASRSPQRRNGGGQGAEEGDVGDGAGSANAAAWEGLTEGGRLPERERRFLGCLRVPLSAIYQAESLEGSFRVGPDVLAFKLGEVRG
jgi:hypothetical protein